MSDFSAYSVSTLPAFSLVLLVLLGGVAVAQEEPDEPGASREPMAREPMEIIVTARKREERLEEVPVAISAFSADDLIRRNIESLNDVAKYTAGMSFENFAGGATPAPIIRGLTQNTLTDRNQNVATFVDGVHIQQQGNIDFTLMELERVEVLRGPQNAQYGRSAFAGAINYVAAKPRLGDFDTSFTLTAGSDEREEYRASVNLPLWGEMLAVRLYAADSEFDGTWSNNFSGGSTGVSTTDASFGNEFAGTDEKLGGWENDAFHAQLRFQPIEQLMLDVGFYRSNIDNEQGAIMFIRPGGSTIYGLERETNCNPSAANGALRFFCGKLDFDADSVRVDPRSVGLQAETELLTSRLEWEIREDLSATYVFGRNDLDQNTFSHSSNPPNPELEGCGLFGAGAPPCPPGPTAVLFLTGPTTQQATSHELRLDGNLFDDVLTWRLGYYHSEVEDKTNVNSVESRRSLLQDPTGQVVLAAFPAARNQFEDKTDAWFGSLGYRFFDIYTLDLEGRYAAEERAQLTSPLAPKTFYEFTPRISLKAQVTPDWMVYGSAAKGSKSGGFNTVTADPGFETFDPETNWTYELGAKQTLLDGLLQLNYNVFYVDWQDLQLPTADLIPTNPSGAADANYITNASGAESMGVEIEAMALVGDHWQINLAVSYADPEFDDDARDFGIGVQCAGSSDPVCPVVTVQRPPLPDAFAAPIGGNQLPRTPKTKVGAGLEYRDEFRTWEYALRGDLSYQDKQYAEVLNLAYLPSRTLLDLNASLTSPNREWTVTLWGKNVTDEEYVSNSFVIAFNNTYGAALAPGAAWGISLRYDFDGR